MTGKCSGPTLAGSEVWGCGSVAHPRAGRGRALHRVLGGYGTEELFIFFCLSEIITACFSFLFPTVMPNMWDSCSVISSSVVLNQGQFARPPGTVGCFWGRFVVVTCWGH